MVSFCVFMTFVAKIAKGKINSAKVIIILSLDQENYNKELDDSYYIQGRKSTSNPNPMVNTTYHPGFIEVSNVLIYLRIMVLGIGKIQLYII